MPKHEIYISCCICGDSMYYEMNVPYYNINMFTEQALCDKCGLDDWLNTQCKNCRDDNGFGHCKFTSTFQYTKELNLTDKEVELVKLGMCPKRTRFDPDNITEQDLISASKVGNKMYKAIMDYGLKFFSEKD